MTWAGLVGLRRLREATYVVRKLAPWVRPHRRTLVLAALAALAGVGAEIARPWPMKIVLDQVILQRHLNRLPEWLAGPEHRWTLLLLACLALLILAGLSGFFNYARTLLLASAGQRIVAAMREELHAHLLRLSLRYHGGQRSGDLLVRLAGDAAMMKTLLVEGIFDLVREMLLIAGVLGIMLALDLQLALAAALTIPSVALVSRIYSGRLRQAARRQRKKEGQIATAVGESLQGVAVIQAYSLEKEAGQRFSKHNRKSLKAGLAAVRLEGAMSRWTELTLASGTAVVLLFGTKRVLDGGLSPGELIVLTSYGRALYKPLRRLVTRLARVVKSSACGERIVEVLETAPDLVDLPDAVNLARVSGEIEFDDVSFAYQPGAPILERVSVKIDAGRHVAIVGRNGAGKSTLVSLIPRLYDPTSGCVRIDGRDLRNVRLQSLRSQIACVFQGTMLFDGTLLENVRMGRPDAGESEVLQAAEAAGVSAFARTLPLGLATPVGEGGLALSGGQRQRVALARALVRDAPVLLLDEPAASLDAEAEVIVTTELLTTLRERTVILVTHQVETLDLVDEVLVMDGGKLVEQGSFAELMTRGGALATLLNRREVAYQEWRSV